MVWDKGKLLVVLLSSVVEQILLILISSVGPNMLRWDLSRDEDFSLRSAWCFVYRSRYEMIFFFFYLTTSYSLAGLSLSLSLFLWHMLHGFLAINDALCSRMLA